MKLSLAGLALTDYELPPPAPDPVKLFLDGVRKLAESAVKKTDVAALTEGEKFAIAYYAGVPMERGDIREPSFGFKMTTVPCGMYHDGEKWRVVMRAEDEPRSRA